MAKNLVIVESPAKAKTIKKFLGSNYKITACMGHVRDLPKSQLGIEIENDFEPKYITIRGKGEILKQLRKDVKSATNVFLATDPDREGEAISWHLYHALDLENKKVKRITFNEISKQAVKASIKEGKDIDMNLVDAQQARRVIDRIVGYTISPLLWKKVKKRLSAGRVQSVALNMICQREDEILDFVPREYWSLDLLLSDQKKTEIKAKFHSKRNEKIELNTEQDVQAIVDAIQKEKKFIVQQMQVSKKSRNPLPPFITSTLQQEASKSLGFTALKTMRTAQALYEGKDIKGMGTIGLISYIRTDSIRISEDAKHQAKDFIIKEYGEEYVNKHPVKYKLKGKSQDAHEAIRPVIIELTPDQIKGSLTKEEHKLYQLIWQRMMQSQMAAASFEQIYIDFACGDYLFRSNGKKMLFDGFLKLVSKKDRDEDVFLPEIKKDAIFYAKELFPQQHFTTAPPRYNEASLIKTLEELGIGRPSTYAPILSTIQQRRYVIKEEKVFHPTELGEIVNDIMQKYFNRIIDLHFTANMENDLDKIEEGDLYWKDPIRAFYPDLKQSYDYAEEKLDKIEIKDEVTDVICEKCGRNMVIKYGSYGKFLACPGFPECYNTKAFFEDAKVACPTCGGKVLIKKTKKGRRYYGCENNPQCDFMSWNKPTGSLCPVCSSHLILKGKNEDKIFCSNAQCSYNKENEKPIS